MRERGGVRERSGKREVRERGKREREELREEVRVRRCEREVRER